jgi:hypothetical protein
MPLVSTNVKLDSDLVSLAKMKGINISSLCREALSTHLRLSGGDAEMIEKQITELEQQKNMIELEIKLLLKQLDACKSNDIIEDHRNSVFERRKTNLAQMYKTKSLDWGILKDVFKFKNGEECKKWLLDKLQKDGLILES